MGSVLYAMATGQPPFDSTSTLKLIHAISNSRPANVRKLNPNIPDWLETIILRLHEPNPDDRFQTAREVIQALKKQTSFARPKRVSPLRRSPSKKIFSDLLIPLKILLFFSKTNREGSLNEILLYQYLIHN